MVAAQQVDVVGEAELKHQHQRDHLDAELAAVHVIAQEEEVLAGRRPEAVEDVEQVEELAVDVAHDHQRRPQPQQVGLAL